jgi:prenyltransferase beta subunit
MIKYLFIASFFFLALSDVPLSAKEELTPEALEAIENGLEWLASQQQPNGSYGGSAYPRHVGITALAGLAFLSHGDLPPSGPDDVGRGSFAENVSRAVDFICGSSGRSGLIAADTSHGPMYGHGFATLFLAEVYGQTPRRDVGDKLRMACDLIIRAQNREGGWRYQPTSADADISVTVCQVMALRSARNAGIHVPKEVIDRAVAYVRRCQNPDGGFRYMSTPGSSAFPRSAAGLATLFYAGVYEGPEIEDALTYLDAVSGRVAQGMSHYYYGQYYAVQAMYLAGGERWERWYPEIRDQLLRRRTPSGFWTDSIGPDYATSMALIILQVPRRYLPILQR